MCHTKKYKIVLGRYNSYDPVGKLQLQRKSMFSAVAIAN